MHESTYLHAAPKLPQSIVSPALESNGAARVSARVGKSDPVVSRGLPLPKDCNSNVHNPKATVAIEEGGTDASFTSNGQPSKLPDARIPAKRDGQDFRPPVPQPPFPSEAPQKLPDVPEYAKSYSQIADLTKDVFAISWELRYPLKDSPGKPFDAILAEYNFTPTVYWHYIGSQYFSTRTPRLAQHPESYLQTVRTLPASTSLRTLFGGLIARYKPSGKGSKSTSRSSATITQLIKEQERELAEHTKGLSTIKHTIFSRLKQGFDASRAADVSCLGFRSADVPQYPSNVCWTYTKKQLAALEALMGTEDVLQDVRQFTEVERAYVTILEQKIQDAPLINDPVKTKENVKSKKIWSEPNKPSKGSIAPGGSRTTLAPSRPQTQGLLGKRSRAICPPGEDTVCQACNEGDYEEGNLIVFCAVTPSPHLVVLQLVGASGVLRCEDLAGGRLGVSSLQELREGSRN
jgi:hypothetical protein